MPEPEIIPPGSAARESRLDDASLETLTRLLDDVFWVLVGESGGCVVPSESDGADNLLSRLQKLPGFDNEALISAMGCTEDRKFLC